MRESMRYMTIIDDIRKQKHFSVQELTEGIMSTKTYYRYKNGKTVLTLDKLFQMINRMKVDILDLLNYFISYHHDEISIDIYVIAILQGNHNFVEKAYQTLTASVSPNKDRSIAIELLYQKYQYHNHKKSLSDYQEHLRNMKQEFEQNHDNIYTMLSNLILLMDTEPFDSDLATSLLVAYRDDILYKQRIPLYLISVNYLLRHSMRQGYSNMEEYKTTLELFEDLAHKYDSKTTIDLAKLYYAYYYFNTDAKQRGKEYLFQYLNSIYFTYRVDDIVEKLDIVSEVFHIDPETFVQEFFSEQFSIK